MLKWNLRDWHVGNVLDVAAADDITASIPKWCAVEVNKDSESLVQIQRRALTNLAPTKPYGVPSIAARRLAA